MTAFHRIAATIVVLLAAVVPSHPALASLAVHPTSYNLSIDRGQILTTFLHITNRGPASPLGYTVTDDRAWLSEYPTSGQIVVGDTVEVTVTVDATSLDPGGYTGTITVVDPHHGPIYVPVTLTVGESADVGESEAGGASSGILLRQSTPNPMREIVEIRFALPDQSPARLAVYDVSGREVAALFDGSAASGETAVRWDGRDRAGKAAPSGIYFYVLESGGRVFIRSLTLSH